MKDILKITAPNGEIKEVEGGSIWEEICPIFQIFDGWFVSESEEDGSTEEWLIQNGHARGVIDSWGGSGFWRNDTDFETLLNPTRKDIERRMKLLAFS